MNPFGGLSQERLTRLVERFSAARIAVMGDFFLDKYLDVDPALAEISVETGRRAHQVTGVRSAPGAAGTVVANLAALGAQSLWAVGFTGDDGEGYELRQGLRRLGCRDDRLLVAPARRTPTYLKPRDRNDPTLAGEHDRYDTKNRDRTPADLQRQLVAALDAVLPQVDAVIVADQVEEAECGVVTAVLRTAISERATRHPQTIFFADSRRRIHEFRNVMLKPNQFEALGVLPADTPPGALDDAALGERLAAMRAAAGRCVFLTCGTRGILVSDPQPTRVPAVPVPEPTDPTGAGDSATAGIVLALCAGADPREAALVGNLVASVTVRQLATTGTAAPEQLFPALTAWRTAWDAAGKAV